MRTLWQMVLAYVSMHRRTPALLCLFSGIFFIVFWAFRLPMRVVIYAMLLCALVTIFIAVGDFNSFCKRHRELSRFITHIEDGIENLPLPDGLIEADYYQLLLAVNQQKAEVISNRDREMTDIKQYYTLWAHQIKTPIAAMDLILQGQDDDVARAIRGELIHIEQYVQMVLYFIRSENSGSDLAIKHCNPDAVIRTALRKYAGMFIRKKLALHYEPFTKTVLTDEKWLAFIIEQLLSNAIKYTDRGQVRLYGRHMTLIVEDSGIGISPEDLPRVFEKGFTGFNGREHNKSTGIGLYLCKRAADMLGHRIHIESIPGVGTKVFLDLSSTSLEVE